MAKVMQEAGIQARIRKKFQITTDSRHAHPVAANVLNRQFDQSTRPNQTWVSDITYVWTRQGWLYLACVVDMYSRKVVGWSMSSQMTKELVLDALQMAIIGHFVSVANPRHVHHFGKAMGSLAKTDRIDAELIALYATKNARKTP